MAFPVCVDDSERYALRPPSFVTFPFVSPSQKVPGFRKQKEGVSIAAPNPSDDRYISLSP